MRARGHPNVLSLHETTLEFTRETHLTPRGDCIFAVAADKSLPDLPAEFKDALRSENAVLTMTVECGGVSYTVVARGHPGLILTHPTDAVIRKSAFICPRTLAVNADKAACDLGRDLVEVLKKGGEATIILEVS